MLKVDLHTHTADDPVDRIPHTAHDLIDRAAALGYDAIAITLHERFLDPRPLTAYAADRGIVLVPGVERTIEGRHVLLLNYSAAAADVRTFDDLARLRARERGLVIAPHPFFPARSCLRSLLSQHESLFDAVEQNAMFTRGLDFNRPALRWAAAHGKPVVGNGDVHRLYQLDTCYSLIDAAPDPTAICEAVLAGRTTVVASPLSPLQAALTMGDLVSAQLLPRPRTKALQPLSTRA